MSNAAASFEASDFDVSVVIATQRGTKLKGNVPTLPFPQMPLLGVEQLIAATLPFADAEQLIDRILVSWEDSFHFDHCVILWQQCDSRTGQYACLNSQGEMKRAQFECSINVEQLALDVKEFLPQSCHWQWIELKVDDVPIGMFGCDQSQQVEIPADWVSVTGRLLATALAWDWTLTQSKLKALGEYAAGAGHEINNPLAAITGRTAQLLKDESDPHRRQLLQTIGAQTYRIRDMIGDSMLFARPPAMQLSQLNLTNLIESVVHQFSEEFSERKISLWGNRESNVEVLVDETQLCVVISELMRNALNAVEDGGRIEIDCVTQTINQQKSVRLRIADNGRGFGEEEREHCFDPFYSGRQAGRGLGFGLSKCWRIINQHRGKIFLNESPNGMTEFLIVLPLGFRGDI